MAGVAAKHTGQNPLDDAPVGHRQILVLVLAVLLSALDGYDALSMAFAAPAVARDWGLGKDVIGLLLSSSLIGMAIGAVALAPLADKLGRRPVVLGALLLLTAGAAISAVASSVSWLAVGRLLTGVGIGAMVAMTTLLAAEFTNSRRRTIAVAACATIGFPLGGVLGGFGAAAILGAASWHWIFGAGSIAGLLLFLLILVALPESPAFVIARRSPDALERANGILSRLGHPAMSDLPKAATNEHIRYRALFGSNLRAAVIRLTVIAVLIAIASYYLMNWLPAMVTDAGFTEADGSLTSAQAGMIGFLGGLFFASFTACFSPQKVGAFAMIGAGLSLVAFGLVPVSLPLLVLSAGAMSFCFQGATAILFTTLATTFPTGLRASGIGFVMGVTRIASALGPMLAGWMFANGMTRTGVSLLFALCPLVAALLIATLPSKPNTTEPR